MSASRAATAMRKEFKADVALECISFHVNSAASFRWARQKRTTIVDQDEQALLAASNAHVKGNILEASLRSRVYKCANF